MCPLILPLPYEDGKYFHQNPFQERVEYVIYTLQFGCHNWYNEGEFKLHSLRNDLEMGIIFRESNQYLNFYELCSF